MTRENARVTHLRSAIRAVVFQAGNGTMALTFRWEVIYWK